MGWSPRLEYRQPAPAETTPSHCAALYGFQHDSTGFRAATEGFLEPGLRCGEECPPNGSNSAGSAIVLRREPARSGAPESDEHPE